MVQMKEEDINKTPKEQLSEEKIGYILPQK